VANREICPQNEKNNFSQRVEMNRQELVSHIAEELEVTKSLADKFVASFTDAVYKNIRKDGVKLVGFGTFAASQRKARTGRNPQTGEEIKIPARWAATFKAGAQLKEAASKKR
jgi:DNA-binding protein HU-beta